MEKKLIKDGSDTRRARYNMVMVIIGAFLLCMGVMMIVIKGLSVEYIDAEGFLHENFFLLPIGFFCMFCGFISFVGAGTSYARGIFKR